MRIHQDSYSSGPESISSAKLSFSIGLGVDRYWIDCKKLK